MANVKFTEFPSAATVGSTDIIPIVQGGLNKKATVTVFSTYLGSLFVNLTGTQTITGSKTFSSQLISNVATGTAPFSIASTTKVTNLNADLLDGLSSADFQLALTNPITGTGTTNYLPKFTGTSALGDSLIYDNGTSVGIGTASPSVAAGLGFVLNGQAGQTRLAFKNTYTGDTSGDGVQFALIGGSSAFVFQNRESDGYFSFETNGSERMRVASDGSIGIGTASPLSQLQVGAVGTTADTAITIGSTTTSTGNLFFGDGSGANQFRGYLQYDHNVDALNFGTSAAERMRITSAGSVGIGTASPASLLEIAATSPTLRINSTTVGYDGILAWYVNTSYIGDIRANSGSGAMTFNQGPSAGWGGYMVFKTDTAERMRITSAGNVGIGTNTPAAKLDVDSTGYSIFANNSGGNRIVKIGTQSASGEPAIQATLGNGTARYLMLNPDGGSILIGTTVGSGYKLDVNGTARVQGQLAVNHSLSGNYGAIIYNTSATGEGLVVRGGSTASHTSFAVQPYDGSVSLFSVVASGAATFSGQVNIGNPVTAAIAVASTHKVEISIGGTTYYLLATT